jgi:exonuclease SbcD
MRLLHTSDWHLGRSLHRADLRDAQAGFLDHLVAVVRAEQVDVVLVSGDVYDRAVPPLDAIALCESAFVRLREAGARVVVISGNHDSARRLGFSSPLIDAAGVFLRTDVSRCAEPIVLDGVSFFAVPYLEPEAVRAELGPGGHVGVLTAALARVRVVAPPCSVVLAHAWVAGGVASDSERDITVGGVSAVPVSLFDGFTYSALGHLHGAQVLSESLRYSGSPLAYSFSEAAQVKGSWLLTLSDGTVTDVSFVEAPVPRRLSSLRGSLEQLLTSAELAPKEHDYLSVVLTDAARPEAAMDRLSARFPHVLVLTHEPVGAQRSESSYAARVAGLSDVEVAASFVAHVRGTGASTEEISLLGQAFDAVRLAEVSG